MDKIYLLFSVVYRQKIMNNFVSRGGIKLQSAIVNFQLSIANSIVLDVGSSTGGFVDCLLQNGAKKVYAVDTCYGELAWKLRNDPRVVVMERTNILHLDNLPVKNTSGVVRQLADDSSEVDSGKVDLIIIDCGWTKLELVLPAVKKFLKPGGIIIALLKPHYEADRKDLVKGVLLPEKSEQVKDQVIKKIYDLGFKICKQMKSPILGGGGNTEYLLLLKL